MFGICAVFLFFFSSRRRHTRCALVTGVQTCALPICLREGQILFTYLHLAADLAQTQGLAKSGAIAIAYETVTSARGGLPLLAPMSEVAGRMSVQVGAHCLEKNQGGSEIGRAHV